jgi:gamma-butyrobetaine dioxygenase
MRKNMVTRDTKHLGDYQLDKQLAMHNDHAFIGDGASGYWQLLHQASGSATAKVVNAAAVANELKRTDPEAFDLLADINVTHALRTAHYTSDGQYTGDIGYSHDGVFEDEATHPIFNLRPNSVGESYLESVRHQEIKRGVCAVPFDKQEAFLAAYRKWIELCESERFVTYVDWPENSLLVLNNAWVMHGRGVPKPDSGISKATQGPSQGHREAGGQRAARQPADRTHPPRTRSGRARRPGPPPAQRHPARLPRPAPPTPPHHLTPPASLL